MIGAIATDNIARGRKELDLMYPELFLPEPVISPNDLETPLYAAHVLLAEGDRAQARRILDRILAVTAARPGQYVPNHWRLARARSYAELGDVDHAMAELTAAKAAGWRTVFNFEDWVWLDKHPTTRALQRDPRFIRLIADLRADLARQRAELLAQRR